MPTRSDPGEVSEAHERRDRVLAALRALPDDQRAALVLVDMEGYSVEEAAQLLGVPAGTVKSRCCPRSGQTGSDCSPTCAPRTAGPGAGNRHRPWSRHT